MHSFRNFLAMLLLLAGNFASIAQDVKSQVNIIQYPGMPEVVTTLPGNIDETSALLLHDGKLWTINDSGGDAEVYGMSVSTGKVEQIVKVDNANNHDWEALAMDETHFYIGDFGNNLGNRKDLKVYKIKTPVDGEKKQTVDAEVINISYADQFSFEIKNRANDFDCESLITWGDSLIVFSKDWDDRMTRMYKFPVTSGDYKITPSDYLDVVGLVTGADYCKKNKSPQFHQPEQDQYPDQSRHCC